MKKMRCAVFGCENTKKKTNNANSELNFYLFPKKDANLCEKWVEFCRRPKCFYVKSARICGDHFRAKDKERNLKYELGFEKAYCPKLRPGAVPCIYKETEEIVHSKINKKLNSFPTVELEGEQTQESLCDTEKCKNSDKDPLTLEEERKRLRIPIVNLNGQQKVVGNRLNKGTENPHTPFKGILAVVYPVDEAGKPLQSAQEQNVRNQIVNEIPIQSKMLANENLLQQLKELKNENNKLKKNEEMFKMNIKELENKVIKSNYERNILEEKLKKIFTSNQIRHMKTGKRVIWSADDMAKAVKLYKTSSAAYRLLKNQNYPFPSQKTVQVWIQMSRKKINESETISEQEPNNSPECTDPSFVDQNSTISENDNDHTIIEEEQMNELLTFTKSTNNEPEEFLNSLKQNALKSKNCSKFSVMEDHSYFLVAD